MQDIARKRDEETEATKMELQSIQAKLKQEEQARSATRTTIIQKENKIKMLESKLGDKASIGMTTVKIEQKVSTPVAQKPPVAGNQKTSSALPKK